MIVRHQLLRDDLLLDFYFGVVFNGLVHVRLQDHFQRNAVPNAVQNALLNNELQFSPVLLGGQGRNAALKQIHVHVQFARAVHVHLVNEVVELRHVNVHLLLLAAHAHAGEVLQLNDVHARDQFGQMPAPAAVHNALRLLRNDVCIPFRHAREKILKGHQIFPGLIVFFAQLPRLVKNGPKPFRHNGR